MIFDTETSSLDTERGFIQEIAWAIYDVESRRLLKSISSLVRWNMQYEVDAGAFAATGLTRDFCEAHGYRASEVFHEFLGDLKQVDAICGHNIIDFDVLILESNIKRCLFGYSTELREKLKIDTMYDLPFKETPASMKLRYLAFDHGYSLTNAHQAMADVFACAHVFFCYKTADVLPIAMTDLVTINGYTQYLDEAGRNAFYKEKFRWNRLNKRWEKRCRAFYIKDHQLELGSHQLFIDETLITPEPENTVASANEEIPF